MSTTPPSMGISEDWLTPALPPMPNAASYYSASMPKPPTNTWTDPRAEQSAESPPSKTYLLVQDQTWPVVHATFTPATNIVSDTRPEIQVAVVTTGTNAIQLLKVALLKGTAALMLPDNRVVTMQSPTIDSMTYLDAAYPEFKLTSGNRILVLKLSCDSRFYRST